MLTVGLLGGMSWQSSAEYYRLLNVGVAQRLGGLHSAKCVLASVDFAEIEVMQSASAWGEAAEVLAQAAQGLERGGVDFVVLCTNTMHKVADSVEAAIGIPLLHLGDATARAVLSAGLDTVGLLGTRFTMEEDFYRDRLSGHGLRVIVPDARDRFEVNRVIYDELCLGVVRDESRERYRTVIDTLRDSGAQGVILGCTEIELLIGPDDVDLPVFPTTRLHVEAAIELALDTEPGRPLMRGR